MIQEMTKVKGLAASAITAKENLVASAAEASEKLSREHWAALRELLAAGDSSAGDVKAVLRHADALGLSASDLPALSVAVEQASRLELIVEQANSPAFLASLDSALRAWADYLEESKQIAVERRHAEAKHFAEANGLRGRKNRADNAKKDLAQLRKRWWKLFGENEPSPDPVPFVGERIARPLSPSGVPADRPAKIQCGVRGYSITEADLPGENPPVV